MGSGTGGDKGFIAVVSVEVDGATLETAKRAIQDALKKATEGVDFKAISDLAKAVKPLTDEFQKAAVNAEKVAQEQAKTEAAIFRSLTAEQQAVKATEATARAKEKNAQTDARALAATEKALQAEIAKQQKYDEAQRKLNAQVASINQVTAKTQEQLAAENALTALLAEQNRLMGEQAAIAKRVNEARLNFGTNPAFNLGAVAGGLSNNFFSTLLSGGGLSSALNQSLGQLQPALFQIAQGGKQATDAFATLGVQGVGAVGALTQGMAGLASVALTIVPIVGRIGEEIGKSYEKQKDFVFQSGILAKQLGTTAEEGAKLRALLTLVGQEDNIFAAITLNQIQAAVASLDRVNKGLETASPQVEKFGQALAQLGVSYQNQNGSLKTFAELVVDISAGLQGLSTAQRSLAIQNLAGLFGSDVAKIFGFGPEGLSTVLKNAVIVTNEQQQANDNLQVSLAGLTSAQTEFNIALTNSLTPLETFTNTVKAGAFKEATDVLGEFFARFGVVDLSTVEGRGEELGGALLKGVIDGVTLFGAYPGAIIFNTLFPDEAALKQQADKLKGQISIIQRDLSAAIPGTEETDIALGNLRLYEAELEKIQARLKEMSSDRLGGMDKTRGITPDVDFAPSLAADKKALTELEKALDAVDAANKDLVDIQKEVIKSNEDTAKSFFSQVDAIQKAAGAYDTFYEKVGQSSTKIAEIQSNAGKTFTQIGTGTVKDVEKAIVDLRVLEERLGKGGSPGEPKFDQLALNIRRRRAALGLQPGELTDIANVDVTVGITGLSKKQIEELNAEFAKLVELKREFLQGGFDVAQTSFDSLLSTLTDLPVEQFGDVLTGGASALQKYAESLGLFASPGFSQAIGEAALKTKLLAGGFGEINTAAGAEAAFAKYLDAFKGFREDLFGLSEFIANPTKLTVPLALDFGLITQTDVTLAAQAKTANEALKDALLEGGEGIGEALGAQAQAALTGGAQQKLGQLEEGGGIVNLLLAKYGITPGKAIEATAEFSIDANADLTLAQKEIDKQFEKLKAEEEAKNRALTLNIEVDAVFNTDAIRERMKEILDAITPGGITAPPKTNRERSGIIPGSGRAAGGDVFRGMPTLVGEEGKPEFFVPRSDGRIIPGNETASLMRLMAGSERMPAQPIVNYSPVVQQYLTVDARGTNARDVTAAINRTQAKQSLFTSSSALVRDRDFLRAHGIR